MSKTYEEAIKGARERYELAMGDAAADALVIAEQFGKPLSAVCKAIDAENWNALRNRADRMKKSQVSGGMEVLARKAERRAASEFRRAPSEVKADLVMEAIAKDPGLAIEVTKAISEKVRDGADLRTGSPNGLKPPAASVIVGDFASLRSQAVRTVSKLGTVRLTGMLREEVEAELDRIDAAVGMARDLITDRKAADWDEALAELMTGGN